MFKVERRITGRGFILLEGMWIQEMQKLFIVNIYAPCEAAAKRELWLSIKQIKHFIQMENGVLWGILIASDTQMRG